MSRFKVSVVLLSSSKSSLSLQREKKKKRRERETRKTVASLALRKEEEDKEDKDKERKAASFLLSLVLSFCRALLFCLVCRRKALISLSAWCRSLVEIERKDTHITRIKTRL